MKLKLALFAAIAAVATPAFAGTPAPSPEIGAGLAAMALVGAGYAFLRRRSAR
jgi:MYXO-CTERM domain-containing protein